MHTLVLMSLYTISYHGFVLVSVSSQCHATIYMSPHAKLYIRFNLAMSTCLYILVLHLSTMCTLCVPLDFLSLVFGVIKHNTVSLPFHCIISTLVIFGLLQRPYIYQSSLRFNKLVMCIVKMIFICMKFSCSVSH